jgi:hexosaminidase
LVHLDLKGAPPKASYIIKLLPLLKELGATGLLIEYEDTFPYSDGLEKYTSRERYSLQQVSRIIAEAKVHNMAVIPLIQSFGHVEWLLKHGDLGELREDPEDPRAFCPSQIGTLELIKTVIDQVRRE